MANKNLYPEGTTIFVIIVAGPNARKDYHYNETEELFYQLEGNIVVKTQQNGKLVEVPLGPGDMFLLPPNIPLFSRKRRKFDGVGDRTRTGRKGI